MFLLIVSFFLLGLIFGSFNTVLCYRIPREIPLGLFSHQRSVCPHCQVLIPWYRNIPLLGYILQKGRCIHCQKPISRRYPLIELSTAFAFALTAFVYFQNPEHAIEHLTLVDYLELAKLEYFTLALVATTFIDLEFRIIPDRFSIGGWILATIAALLWGSPPLLSSLLGAAFGFGCFFLLAWVYEKWKKVEGLGFGDVKMMAWIGAWLGVEAVPQVILLGSISGLVVGLLAMRRSKDGLQTAIPFGPFLAFGAYVVWIYSSLR